MTLIWARRYDDNIVFTREKPEEANRGWWHSIEVDEKKLVEWEAVEKAWNDVQNELWKLHWE